MTDRKLRPRNKEINYLEIIQYKSPVNFSKETDDFRKRNLRPRKVYRNQSRIAPITPIHERNLRPRKSINYSETTPFTLRPIRYYRKYDYDDMDEEYSPQSEKKQKITHSKPESHSKPTPFVSVLQAIIDESDDEDEYKSLREENKNHRFNVLKSMGFEAEKEKLKDSKGITSRAIRLASIPKENSPALLAINLSTNDISDHHQNENTMDIVGEKSKLRDAKVTNSSKYLLSILTAEDNNNDDEYSLQRRKRMIDRLEVLKTLNSIEEISYGSNYEHSDQYMSSHNSSASDFR